MGSAELLCEFTPLDREKWTRGGSCKIEFAYRAAAGMTPRPLARIASGGEVSRVMLAVKASLGAADTGETLVFDEVDAGVGGSVALSSGRRFGRLAATHQVIVVTHLAQVAVRAQTHYMVRKVSVDSGSIPGNERWRSLTKGTSVRSGAYAIGRFGRGIFAHAKEMLGMA